MTDYIQDDSLFGDEHVKAYEETDGQRGYLWRNGTEILLLTTKGRKTGEERTTPLIHRQIDGKYVIVASKGGTPDDPFWLKNIEADDNRARIQVKADTFDVTASVAEGEERAKLWDALAEVWPDYNEYAKKTDREIPVVVLTPQ